MTARHVLTLQGSATRFADSLLLGDGRLGVTLAGDAPAERFDLNADTLWSGGPVASPSGEAPSSTLPGLRAAIDAGDWAEADRLAFALLGDRWSASYEPAGTIRWRWCDGPDPSSLERSLDLSTGLARTRVRARDGDRALEVFVDPVSSVAVAVTAGGAASSADVATPHPVTAQRTVVEGGVDVHLVAGRVPEIVVPNYAEDDEPIRYPVAEPDADGTVASGMGFAIAWAVHDDGAQRRLLSTVVTGFRGADQRPSADPEVLFAAALDRLRGALSMSTPSLRDRAVAAHAAYFDRFDLDLSPSAVADPDVARAELFFDLGRYLLIASSRPGTQAAGLQGIWNIDVRPGWSANYTTNINTPMNYWGVEGTGVGDLHEPLFDFLRDARVAGREAAARIYGAGGAVLHHNTDVWRLTTPPPITPQYALWPSAFAWLVSHSWDHVAFAADGAPGFVRDTALPLHRDAVAFALDMLVDDGDGGLIASPSTSPEHAFVLADGTRAAVSAGTAMDQEMIRELFAHYLALVDLAGAHATPEDGALAARARAARDRVRLPVVREGVLQEWRHDELPIEQGHRHLSHLFGLFPGTRITLRQAPDDLEAARAALQMRLEGGSGYTGWSQAWVLCLAARLRDRALAEQSLRRLTHDLSSASMLDLHPHDDWPGGAIFQIDGNLGAVGGVLELLAQSHDDVIDLLPTLPRAWQGGSVRGIRLRGGHTLAMTWAEGRLVSAELIAGYAPAITIEVVAAGLDVRAASGGRLDARVEDAPDGSCRANWSARAGARYLIEAR